MGHGLGSLHSQLATPHANADHALALHGSNELKRACLVDMIVADINLQTQVESWLDDCTGWYSGWAGLRRTDVSEAMTKTSSAMALAPSTPSLQCAMPMLSMLLPFIAAMSWSEAAWSISL